MLTLNLIMLGGILAVHSNANSPQQVPVDRVDLLLKADRHSGDLISSLAKYGSILVAVTAFCITTGYLFLLGKYLFFGISWLLPIAPKAAVVEASLFPIMPMAFGFAIAAACFEFRHIIGRRAAHARVLYKSVVWILAIVLFYRDLLPQLLPIAVPFPLRGDIATRAINLLLGMWGACCGFTMRAAHQKFDLQLSAATKIALVSVLLFGYLLFPLLLGTNVAFTQASDLGTFDLVFEKGKSRKIDRGLPLIFVANGLYYVLDINPSYAAVASRKRPVRVISNENVDRILPNRLTIVPY